MRRRNWILLALAFGMMLNPLNSSMIAVAIVRLQQVFSLNFADVSWIISTYYLSSAIVQPVMGKVADSIGRKRVFIAGLIAVIVASVTAPFSPTFTWLLAFRLIQSVGSGAMYPAGMAIVRQWMTKRQAQALAFLAAFSSGAAAFGPAVGGFLMRFGDWPALFFVNLPIIVVGLGLAIFLLPPDRFDNSVTDPSHGAQRLASQLDIPGIVLFGGMIVLVLVFLLSLTTHVAWGTGIAGLALLVLFGWWELRVDRPFIDLRMFRDNPPFTWVDLQFVTANIIFYSIFFAVPDYLQASLGLGTQMTGIMMLCIAGASVLVMPFTGRWVDRSGSRPSLVWAGGLLTVGSLLFLSVNAHSPLLWIGIVLVIIGVSNAFNNIGLQAALFAVTPGPVMGTASGLFMTARYMGTILSSVLLGLIFRTASGTPQLHLLGITLGILGVLVTAMSLAIPMGRHVLGDA